MYNVLEKLKVSLPMAATEKAVYEMGLVSVLKSLHDELDAAVLAAYGWNDAPSDEILLERLLALNAERAAEEAAGQVQLAAPPITAPRASAAGSGGDGLVPPDAFGSR